MSHRDDRAKTTIVFGRVLLGKKSIPYRAECRDNQRKYRRISNLAERVQANTDEFLLEAIQADAGFKQAFISGNTVLITLDESRLK